jgi:tetratricopeptide (TPR) repeat protein
MARKRVNVKFLVILTAVVVLGGASVLAVHYYRKQKLQDPAHVIAAAEEYYRQGDLSKAADAFAMAVKLQPQNVPNLIRAGDVYYELSGRAPEAIEHARRMWTNALEAEPNNIEAQRRMMRLTVEEMELRNEMRSVEALIFERVRSYASKIKQAQPDDSEAIVAEASTWILAWVSGVVTPASEVEAALKALQEQAPRQPTNWRIPWLIAQAKLRQGQEQKDRDPAAAAESYATAAQAFEAALAAAPEDPSMHFRAATVFQALARLDSGNQAAHRDRAQQLLARAAEVAKPQDRDYALIHLTRAELANANGDRAGAGKILAELHEQVPDDQRVRLALAQVLMADPAKREEAEKILAQPIGGGSDLVGVRAMLVRHWEFQTQLMLMNLRMDLYQKAEGARKEELGKAIDDALKVLEARSNEPGDPNTTQGLKSIYFAQLGRRALMRGEVVNAVQSLSRAVQMQQRLGQPDLETMQLLGQAYLLSGQTGEARRLLAQVHQHAPRHVPARVLMAQALLAENNREEALKHLAEAEKQTPDDPTLRRLKISAMDRSGEGGAERVRSEFDALPESTAQERFAKAFNAVQLNLPDEAERLLKAVLAENPAEPPAVELLTRLYVARGQKEEALAVLDAALAAKPDTVAFKAMREAVENPTAEQMEKSRRAMIEDVKEPLERELLYFDLARDLGRIDEALQHLKAAEKIKSDDPRVLDALFQTYLATRKFEDAEKYVEPLAKLNRDRAGGLVYRFRLAMTRGDLQKSLEYGRQLTEKYPEFAVSWVSEGQALFAAGRFDQAIQKFQVALEKQPSNIDATRGVIDSYYRLQRISEAKRYLDDAIKRYPGDAGFRELALAHETRYGDPEKALPPREQAFKRSPNDPRAWLVLGETYLRAAQARAVKKDESGAKSFLAKARETFTGAYAKWPEDRAFAAYVAETSLLSGDVAAAEKALMALTMTKAWEERPEPRLMLAQFYARLGKLDDAEQFLRLAVQKSNNSEAVCIELSNFLYQRGKVDEALSVLEPHSASVEVQRRKIEMLINAGRAADAEKSVMTSLAAAPKDKGLLTLAAVVHMRLGNMEAALKRANEALAVDSNYVPAMFHRALVKLNMTQPDIDGAIKDLTMVRDAEPRHIDARFALAEAYRRRGDTNSALLELESTLRLSPEHKGVRAKLIELYAAESPARWGEVERLLNDAKSNPQLQADPDWDLAEAQMWLARADNAKAIAAAQRARQLAPGSAEVLNQYLGVLLQTRSVRRVIEETDKVLEDPNAKVWWIYRIRGIARALGEDKTGAAAELQMAFELADKANDDAGRTAVIQTLAQQVGTQRAIDVIQERSKSEPRWLLMIAYLYQSAGNEEKAIETIEQVLAQLDKLSAGDQVNALRFAGTLYLTSRPPMVEKSEQAYMKLLERQSEDLAALNNLACLLAESANPPRPAQALTFSQKAYDLVRKHGLHQPLILDTHGWVLVLNGQLDEGISLLQEVVDRSPFLEAHYHLGMAYLKRRLPVPATTHLNAANSLIEAAERAKQPVDPLIQQKIQQALVEAREMRQAD